MNAATTAIILIGYQNDYFAPDGILRSVVEESSRVTGILHNTVQMIERLAKSPVQIIHTPIVFTENYSELQDPVGILRQIRDAGAFLADSKGGATIDELAQFGDRLLHVPGKRGLNAFSNTRLESVLRESQIRDVVLAGAVTSICIDSTGRSAHERGFRVSILSDCTSARSISEQEFYCD